MSIYASFKGIDDWEHKPRCKRLERISRCGVRVNPERPCTCGSAPIIYQGSNIMPSEKDERGGSVDIAGIPGHITDEHGKALNKNDDIHPWWPFLRVGVSNGKDGKYADVVLTKAQVKSLRDELTSWLKHAKAK